MLKSEKIICQFISLLNDFFNEKNAVSFSIFSWIQNKETPIAIDFKFHYQIINNQELIEGSGESILFQNINLCESFMNTTSIYSLSKKIEKRIKHKEINKDELKVINFFNGITFYKTTWKSDSEKIFGDLIVKEFFSRKLYKDFNNIITVPLNKISIKEKIIKL